MSHQDAEQGCVYKSRCCCCNVSSRASLMNISSEMKCSRVAVPPDRGSAQPFLAVCVGCDLGLHWRSFPAELGTLGEEGTGLAVLTELAA